MNHLTAKATGLIVAATVAATGLVATTTATAQTPPAPVNNGPVNLSDKPLAKSGHRITPVSQTSTSDSITIKWKATKQFVTMPTSTVKPQDT